MAEWPAMKWTYLRHCRLTQLPKVQALVKMVLVLELCCCVVQLQGCLILVGVIHALIGGTGLIGFLLRFIGPVTIVPTILLLGIYVVDPILDFCVPNWGITFL